MPILCWRCQIPLDSTRLFLWQHADWPHTNTPKFDLYLMEDNLYPLPRTLQDDDIPQPEKLAPVLSRPSSINSKASGLSLESDKRMTQMPRQQEPPNPLALLTYFQCWRLMLRQNRLFFFHEILSGNLVKQVFKRIGLGCLCGNSGVDPVDNLFLKIYWALTPNWMPSMLRPFVLGLFIPLLILLVLNHNFLNNECDVSLTWLNIHDIFAYITCVLFVITAVRTGGSMKTNIWKYRSAGMITQKPWLKSYKLYCIECQILTPLRSYHCKYCQKCTPKYTKHSIVFNGCIGATNQLIYMAFQGVCFLSVTIALALFAFPTEPLFSSARNFMVRAVYFIVNSYVQGLSGLQFLRGLLYTLKYNCTEYQVSNWSALPYLCTFDRFRFSNIFNRGICNNLAGSAYALLGYSGSDDNSTIYNWAKTFYYYPFHIPSHPQSIQWSLYYQEQDDINSKRHKQILKETQLLRKIQSDQSWSNWDDQPGEMVLPLQTIKPCTTGTQQQLIQGNQEQGQNHKWVTQIGNTDKDSATQEKVNKTLDF